MSDLWKRLNFREPCPDVADVSFLQMEKYWTWYIHLRFIDFLFLISINAVSIIIYIINEIMRKISINSNNLQLIEE